MWVLIWGYWQQDLVKFSNFRFIYSLFRENIETKFAGKKGTFKTLLLYFVSFSVILSFLSVSLKVRRVEWFFKMFFSKIFPFPYISMFSAHFVAYLSSLLELPWRGRSVHDHQGRRSASSSFSYFLFLTGEGMEAKPQIKNWHIFLQFRYLSLILEITLRVLGKLWVYNVFKLRRQILKVWHPNKLCLHTLI